METRAISSRPYWAAHVATGGEWAFAFTTQQAAAAALTATAARLETNAVAHTVASLARIASASALTPQYGPAPLAEPATAAFASLLVGRCSLKPVETRVESARFQRLKLKRDEVHSSVAFSFNFRRCMLAPHRPTPARPPRPSPDTPHLPHLPPPPLFHHLPHLPLPPTQFPFAPNVAGGVLRISTRPTLNILLLLRHLLFRFLLLTRGPGRKPARAPLYTQKRLSLAFSLRFRLSEYPHSRYCAVL